MQNKSAETKKSNLEHNKTHQHEQVNLNADKKLLVLALICLSVFLLFEFGLGFYARSLALITDSAHMLTDVASIVLALVAINYSRRPADSEYTYGWQRVQILSAQINGIALIILAVIFIKEAISRIINPTDTEGSIVLITALVGIVVNLLVTLILSKANKQSLNVKGAYLHILTDLFAFIGTAIAGVVILVWKWDFADTIASLLVAALMLKAGWSLVRESTHIFLEAAPSEIDTADLAKDLLKIPGVVQIHDLHVWTITSEQNAISAHVLIEKNCNSHIVTALARDILQDKYDIHHITLQVDHITGSSIEVSVCETGSHGKTYSETN